MKYQSNFSLKEFNTFGIDVKAKKFISVTSIYELKQVLKENKEYFLIGGGSNMLLTKNIEKTVIHLNLKGLIVNNENSDTVEVTGMAGENWHEFVLWCIQQNYGGLENLSLIPGNVGTSPIQNIGAYGVEIKDNLLFVEALHVKTLEIERFSNSDCEFGYRDSIFKNKLKDQYVITSVTFKLTKRNHKTNTSYGAIQELLTDIKYPTLTDISNAVIAIRKSKLPDPKKIGNSGSFFKNPIINYEAFKKLQYKYPKVPFYKISDAFVKIPAGWLIEQAGFKGQQFGNAGVHNKQALVLVNYGNATGLEIFDIAQKIQKEIFTLFNITLEIEVNIF